MTGFIGMLVTSNVIVIMSGALTIMINCTHH